MENWTLTSAASSNTTAYSSSGAVYVMPATYTTTSAATWPASLEPARPRTALEWLDAEVEETCARGRLAA